MKILFYVLLLAGVFTACDIREQRLKSFDKDYWIQVAIGSPLPSGVSELQGIGDTWQGFGCYFRFRIDPQVLQKHLTTNGYELETTAPSTRKFALDPRFEKYFSPKWSPNLSPASRVYVRYPSDYSTFVLVSSDSDWVHVLTIGSHSPGPFPTNQAAQNGGVSPATPGGSR